MIGLRLTVRDLFNRHLENDDILVEQTKALSGKQVIVSVSDLLSAPMSLNLKIGADGLVDDVVISDKVTEEAEQIIRITVTKKFVQSRVAKVASEFLSPDKDSTDQKSLFGQGLKVEGDVDDIQVIGDIVEVIVDRIVGRLNSIKLIKTDLAKGAGLLFGDLIVGRKEFDQQSRILSEIIERLKNIEKDFNVSR